jgi:hypothetical protein
MREPMLDLEHAAAFLPLVIEIRALLGKSQKMAQTTAEELTGIAERLERLLNETPDDHAPAGWHVMPIGLRLLASHAQCLAIAHGEDGDLVEERARGDVLADELRQRLAPERFAVPAVLEPARQSLVGATSFDPTNLREFLLSIPLPTLYWKQEEPIALPRDETSDVDVAPDPLLRVIVFLDNAPVASPQLLKAGLLYPLVLRVRGLTWPEEAQRLRLDVLTTCPASEYAISSFVLEKPALIEDFEYNGELAGQIKFNSGQSSVLDDLVFEIRAAFELPDGDFREVPVIGHHALRLRVVDENQHPLMSGNRRLDRHTEELLMKVLKECPGVRDELPDLFPMLQALGRLLATYAQEAVFKGRSDVSEAEFHRTVLRDLRFQLGQDVQEHPGQAGGITDIRYRGVIVELKVEKTNGDRQSICKSYTAQSAQYAGVEARQTSVVLVLDVTKKLLPPGDIRNDILLTDVATHGGDDSSKRFPSKAFIFVVNGNVKSPSSYSR